MLHSQGYSRKGAARPVSRGIFDLCTCGHRFPEHSLFGTCRGCLDCPDVESRPAGDADTYDDDHPYRQCECRTFAHDEAASAQDAETRMEGASGIEVEDVEEPAEPPV